MNREMHELREAEKRARLGQPMRDELRVLTEDALARQQAKIKLREEHQANIEADAIIDQCKEDLRDAAKGGHYRRSFPLKDFKITHLDLVRVALEQKTELAVAVGGDSITFDWSD